MLRASAILAILAAATPAARADRRYGDEIIGVEAIGWTFVATGGRFAMPYVMYPGFGIVLLGPAAVHLVIHDRGVAAAESLGVDVGLPGIGLLAGLAIDPCRGEGCTPVGPILGMVVGYAGALVIDAVFLAKEPTKPAATPREHIFSYGIRF
jgi:hypothetical protein